MRYLILGAMLIGCAPKSKGTDCSEEIFYKLPSGAKCRYMAKLAGLVEFSQCSDGFTYLNPESYSQVSEKVCR